MRRVRSWLLTGLSSVVRRGRRPVWPILAVLAGVAIAAVLAIASTAQAAPPLTLKLRPQGTSGAVSLSGETCATAVSALDAKTGGTLFTLAVAPPDYPSLTMTNVTIATNAPSCTTLVLSGSSTVFSQSATVVVVGSWGSATAKTPTFSVVVRFATVGLVQLLASAEGANIGATFSHVWLAATTASGGSSITITSTATTGALTAIKGFFTGFHGTTVQVAGSGLTFAGDLSSGDLATGLGKLDVSTVQLTGDLVGSLSTFSASAPPKASAGFKVTASFKLDVSDLPSWLAFPTTGFTLSVSGTSSGTWTVAVTGKATVTLPPNTKKTQFTVDLAITKSGGKTPVTVSLSVQMGKLSDAFGLTWLTLTTTSLTWTVSSTSLTATLHGTVKLGTAPTTLDLTATVSLSTATGATATLSLKTGGHTLSTSALATDLNVRLPTHTPTLSLKNLVVYLKVPKSGSVTVAVEAGATLTLATTSHPISFLFRDEVGTSVIVAAKSTSPLSLKQLDSSVPTFINVTLTHLAVVFSTATVTLKSKTLDPPTKAYFQPLYCSSGSTCTFTVGVKAGVTIQAAVTLPTSVSQVVCKLIVKTTAKCLTGPVTIDGHIPLFSSTTFSLTIALPTVELSSGPVRRVSLDLSLAETKGITVTASGKMVMLAPSSHVTGNTNCPTGVTTATKPTDICLTLTLAGSLKASAGGVSITFSAVVTTHTGWRLPNPVTWLTIDRLAAVIGVTSGETGVGLTIGVSGTFTLGATTLGFAIKVKLTPEAPWVDLLGFKVKSVTGIGKEQIADLYRDATGNSLTSNLLPPLALKDILFEYAATSTATLGLCQGLHISADLVITNGHWSKGTYTPPTSVPCNTTQPTRSTACTANKSSCLASVLLTISPTGFVGRGHITGWNAGPVVFTPTTLDVTITKTEVQIHISGGGELLTPFAWPNTGLTSPEWFGGSITLTVGTERLHLSATGDIGSLSGKFTATGSLSTLENPFSKIGSFFTTTVAGALKTAGTHIKSAMTTVGKTVSAWYTTYIASTGNQAASDIQREIAFLNTATVPTWEKVWVVFETITSAISGWNSAVGKIHLTFLKITAGAVFHDALHGIHVNGWTVCTIFGCITIIPGFTIPGVCSSATLSGTPLCTSSTLVTAAQESFANPSVESHLTSVTLSLPTGATDKTLITKVHSVDPTGPTTITCASATETYKLGTESDTSIQVDTLGNSVTISGPTPNTLGTSTDTNSIDNGLDQDTLNSLYTGTNQGRCGVPETAPKIPSLSMTLLQSSIIEGGTVTAVVNAGTGVTSVWITWGDGSTRTLATHTATNDDFVTSHVYLDVRGAGGTSSPFTVTASATVKSGFTTPLPVSTQVRVLPAPLELTPLTVSPSNTISVMQTVTVSGKLLNPEPGQPVSGTITWGDGTQTSVTVQPTGDFSATHLYDRLTPAGEPEATEPVTVSLSETDGTTATVSTSVTVHDVPPTNLISPTSGGVVANKGTVFTHTGTSIGETPEVTDVSPVQAFTFTFDWNDGTKKVRISVTAPTPMAPSGNEYTYPVALGTVTHSFANACLYTVAITATDDDTLATTLTTPFVVTAPLGFMPAHSSYWQQQFASPPPRGAIAAATLACYLAIAQHLSPELGALTPAAAESILKDWPAPAPHPAQLVAQLRQQLLTTLLNFANGSWNWTEPVGANEQSLQALVTNANQALTSSTPVAMLSALKALRMIQGAQQLEWSPNTNGLYSFGTLAAGTTATKTFTITDPDPRGKLDPLPTVLTVSEVGSAAFTITANNCPTGPAPPHGPPRTACTVTVKFAPATSDTTYSAVLTVVSGPPPPKGPALPPVLGSLTLSGTTT